MGNLIFKGLVANKDKYRGGEMKDYGDSMDRRMVSSGMINASVPMEATITNISIRKNYFSVDGEPFGCGGDMNYLHVTHNPGFELESGGMAFVGYGGHEWHIYPHLKKERKAKLAKDDEGDN